MKKYIALAVFAAASVAAPLVANAGAYPGYVNEQPVNGGGKACYAVGYGWHYGITGTFSSGGASYTRSCHSGGTSWDTPIMFHEWTHSWDQQQGVPVTEGVPNCVVQLKGWALNASWTSYPGCNNGSGGQSAAWVNSRASNIQPYV